MGTMTPAQRRALYESARFARETTYNGPLGPEYTPAGTRLQLWAPTCLLYTSPSPRDTR